MKNKFIALFSLSVLIFSCAKTPNTLGNKDFKTNSTVNNKTNLDGSYSFDGMINRTDGLPVPVPTPKQEGNKTIQTYDATLFAGSYNGTRGHQDGQGSNALFDFPFKIIADSHDNLFVLDDYPRQPNAPSYALLDYQIRKITPDGTVAPIFVTTFDGLPSNDPIIAQTFTIDSDDNIYAVKTNSIYKVTPDGTATTVYSGFAGSPFGIVIDRIAVDPSKNIYLTDTTRQLIKKISSNGVLSVVAGQLYNDVSSDGNGTNATFNYPSDIISDNNGNLYVSSPFDAQIRKINSNNDVTTLTGKIYGNAIKFQYAQFEAVDGNKNTSVFSYLWGIAFDKNKNNIIVADFDKIRKVDLQGNTTTLVINSAEPSIFIKTSGNLGNFFNNATNLAVDSTGKIYVVDQNQHRIIKLTPSTSIVSPPKDNKKYITTTLSGNGNIGSISSQSTSSTFNYPKSIAVNSSGLFISDVQAPTIRKVDLLGNASDFYTGSVNNPANKIYLNNDSTLTVAFKSSGTKNIDSFGTVSSISGLLSSFSFQSITKNSSGNIFMADSSLNVIKNQNFSIFSGTGVFGDKGLVNGSSNTAKFNLPQDLATDSANNIYVADSGNNAIRKIDPSGNVTTLAGSTMEGYKDGNGINARFRQPCGIAVDSLGYIYVADTGNNAIRKIAPNGDVWTIGGNTSYNFSDGVGTTATFNQPLGIAVDNTGTVFVADTNNQRIRKLSIQ